MPIIPASSSGTAAEDRDATLVSVNKKLAVANTSEILFTIPTGFVGRFVSLTTVKDDKQAYIKVTPGGPATLTDFRLDEESAWGDTGLQLAEGDYHFIGDTGKRPRVTGVVGISPTPV